MQKLFYQQNNVGKARYVINYFDGATFHEDKSAFYEMRIFSNKKALNRFIKELLNNGYVNQSRQEATAKATSEQTPILPFDCLIKLS